MAIHTTALAITTTPSAVISTATTWASLRGASITDPIPFSAFNDGAARIYLTGSSATTLGFPLLSSGTWTASLLKSDAIFAVTSAGAASTLHVMAGRQTGGAQ